MIAALPESALDWVLVIAPFRKDAEFIGTLLSEHAVKCEVGSDSGDAGALLSLDPGVIVISHEGLNPALVAAVADYLGKQPDWSEVPILVLLERTAPLFRIRTQLQAAWPRARLLFYHRPIAPLELVNGIQSNLLVRVRQRQVRDSFDRETELRLELNHRVKNILASVTSIFQMTRRGAATVETLTDDFMGRLQALSNVHSAVFEAGGEAVSLLAVVSLIVSPYNSNGTARINATGMDIVVSREAGTTIALCLHELITNAIKYGALSRPEGKVNFVWNLDAANTLSLTWTESGGPPVVQPSRQGYGTRYIRSALRSLFGEPPEITFEPEGFQCRARGPMRRAAPDKI